MPEEALTSDARFAQLVVFSRVNFHVQQNT